ncbi:MAG: hypothetical protein JNL01_12635 [Bdellovibrionales bacterium]|nr:hypothetical protein [Bdellovibrionales bacterium]
MGPNLGSVKVLGTPLSTQDPGTLANGSAPAMTPLLEDSVLCGRSLKYFFHRIRYFWIWFPVTQAVHIAELFLLSNVMDQKGILSFAFYQFLFDGILGFHWGSLEVDRAWTRQNQNHQQETLHWDRIFSRSVANGMFLGAGFAAFAFSQFSKLGVWTVQSSFILAVSIRLVFEMPLQAWQSKIFSRSRIYRPLLLTLGTPMFHGLSLWIGWEAFNIWAFAFAQLASTLFRAITGYWIYRRIQAPPVFQIRHLKSAFTDFTFSKLTLGLAQLMIRMAMPAVLAFSATIPTHSFQSADLMRLSFLMILASPALKAANSWTQLFHFDFARLRDSSWGYIRKRFALLGLAFGFLPSFYASLVAVLSIVIVQKEWLGLGSWAQVLLLCLSQGVLSWVVMVTFTARQPLRILGTALVSGYVIFSLAQDPARSDYFGILLASRLIPTVAFLITLRRPKPEVLVQQGGLPFASFYRLSLDASKNGTGKWLQWETSWQTREDHPAKNFHAGLNRLIDRPWTKNPDTNAGTTYTVLVNDADDASRIVQKLAGLIHTIRTVPVPTILPAVPIDPDFHIDQGNQLQTVLTDDFERRRIYRSLDAGVETRVRLKSHTVSAQLEDGQIVGLKLIPRSSQVTGSS